MAKPVKILELEFTILEFYNNYVISQAREGVLLAGKQIADLIEVCSDFYAGKNFVYLVYRINDYNVDPTIYLNLNEVRNLAGIGVVSRKPSSLNMAGFEKRFSKVPYEIFLDLDKALMWAQEVIEEKNKKADL